MKKILILLCITLTIIVTGCGNKNQLSCKGPGLISSPCKTNDEGVTSCDPFGNSYLTVVFDENMEKMQKIKLKEIIMQKGDTITDEEMDQLEGAFKALCTNFNTLNLDSEGKCNVVRKSKSVTIELETQFDIFSILKGNTTYDEIKKYIGELETNYQNAGYDNAKFTCK